jgi:hypothetical protein
MRLGTIARFNDVRGAVGPTSKTTPSSDDDLACEGLVGRGGGGCDNTAAISDCSPDGDNGAWSTPKVLGIGGEASEAMSDSIEGTEALAGGITCDPAISVFIDRDIETCLAVEALVADGVCPSLSSEYEASNEGSVGGGGGTCPWLDTARPLRALVSLAVDALPADAAWPALSSEYEAPDGGISGGGGGTCPLPDATLLALTSLAVDTLPAAARPALSSECEALDEGSAGGGGGTCPWPGAARALRALTPLADETLLADLAWPTLSGVCAVVSDEGNSGGGGGTCPWLDAARPL